MSDILYGQDFEEEIEGALKYHDKIRHAISRIRILHEKYDLSTENAIVRAVPLPIYFLKAAKRDCEFSSTEDIGKRKRTLSN